MFRTASDQPKQDSQAIERSLGYDYALLGLPAREARVEVIRKAAMNTASRIHEAAIDAEDQDAMLSDLAVSTYRLLDPRRRRRMMERVQLSIYSEEDLELQKNARSELLANSVARACTAQTDEAFQVRKSNDQVSGGGSNSRSKKTASRMLPDDTDQFRVGAITVSLIVVLCLVAMAALAIN